MIRNASANATRSLPERLLPSSVRVAEGGAHALALSRISRVDRE